MLLRGVMPPMAAREACCELCTLTSSGSVHVTLPHAPIKCLGADLGTHPLHPPTLLAAPRMKPSGCLVRVQPLMGTDWSHLDQLLLASSIQELHLHRVHRAPFVFTPSFSATSPQ